MIRKVAIKVVKKVVTVVLGMAFLSLFAFCGGPAKKDDVGAKPVAVVNGEPITLRMLEDEMLKREGAEKIQELVHQELENMPWSTLDDGVTLVSMNNWKLTRGSLSAQMLADHAGPVRAELIRIKVIQQALTKAAIVVDKEDTDVEIARMQHKIQQQLLAQGQGKVQVDFASYIKQTQKVSLDEFIRQPGFQIMAGMHKMVARDAKKSITEAEVRAYFDSHLVDYRHAEAVDLSVIFVPYHTDKDPGGKGAVSSSERAERLAVMNDLYAAIATGKQEFGLVWKWYGQAYDHDASSGGAIGWVSSDGKREKPDARVLPKEVIGPAFTAKEPFPVLVGPIATDTGVEIVQVKAHRSAQEPDFKALYERILNDCIDDQLEDRTKALSKSLYDASVVDHISMPDLILERQRQSVVSPDAKPVPPSPAPVKP